MINSISFPKEVRLLTSGDYSRVFESVDFRVSSRYFLILARKQKNSINETSDNTARLGIIVAKKNVKLAVQRNRVKRLMRESFRHKRNNLPYLDIVILAKKNAHELSNEHCDSELRYLWKKLNRKCNSK